VEIMHKDPKIKPDAYTKEEEEFLKHLINKHGKRLGTKEEKYRIF